jgi:mRNA interferase MazF
VVSSASLQDVHSLLWVVMVTSAENRGWPSDVSITGLARAGLPVASVVCPAKIATIDAADATKLGSVSGTQLRKVMDSIGQELSLLR